MTARYDSPASPRWNAITKLVVALVIVVIFGALLIRFRNLIAPILMASVLAYLLHPVASFLTAKTPLSWKAWVNIIYLVLVGILVTLLTLGGMELVQQVQNLIRFIQNNIDDIPAFVNDLSSQISQIGPLALDSSEIDWQALGDQVLGYIEPALGSLGNMVGRIASSAASMVGWLIFILVVSYFFLLESGGLRERIIQIEIPLYAEDVRRMRQKLNAIWNAFLRGQIIIFLLTSLVYALILSVLGVRYAVVLALITGFANFLPYVGPAINWLVLGLVTYFQPTNLFGLAPLAFTGLVIAIAFFIDQIFNNLINPRVMASALRVHPAFVLIAALIAANLFGVIGVILAAPLLATFQLISKYVVRKMLDRDPWPPGDDLPPPSQPSLWQRFHTWLKKRRSAARPSRATPPAE
ncbi:MAG: AI-2E family transporter [Anaerolineales bacterium]